MSSIMSVEDGRLLCFSEQWRCDSLTGPRTSPSPANNILKLGLHFLQCDIIQSTSVRTRMSVRSFHRQVRQRGKEGLDAGTLCKQKGFDVSALQAMQKVSVGSRPCLLSNELRH